MRRHEFDAALTVASMTYSLVARAPQARKIYHVGIISFRSQSDLGHIEGKTMASNIGSPRRRLISSPLRRLEWTSYPRLAAASLVC
jgi:hypothetical protein